MTLKAQAYGLKIIRAHKIALDPNNSQVSYFYKACGTKRYAYNWALSTWITSYKTGNSPNANILSAEWTKVRPQWAKNTSDGIARRAIQDVGKAFNNFFNSQKGKRKGPKVHYPKMKSKKKSKDSFYISNDDSLKVEGKRIHLPRVGWIRMKQELRFPGKIMSATVSRSANRWFVSILVQIEQQVQPISSENQAWVGVDLGLKTLAVLSNGKEFKNPAPLRKAQKQLARLNRSLARKFRACKKENKLLRYCKNFQKEKLCLQKLHVRIANIRNNALHQLTHYLVSNFDCVAIEDLNVAGMIKNPKLALGISDVGFGEFRRQLEYKSEQFSTQLKIISRWEPTSKTCSNCGFVRDFLALNIRQWTCERCAVRHERDLNAAKNIETAGRLSVAACGGFSSGRVIIDTAKLSPLKQELGSAMKIAFQSKKKNENFLSPNTTLGE